MELTVVVLAGGFGSRLGAMTRTTPKPLIPVRGVPVLDHVLTALLPLNCSDVRVVGAYLGHQVEAYLADRWPQYRYVEEREPRGTANAFWAASSMPFAEAVMVCNGDTVLEGDVRRLSDMDGWAGALALAPAPAHEPTPRPLGQRNGAVTLDPNGGLVHAGYVVVRADALGDPGPRVGTLEEEVVEPLVRAGKIRAVTYDAFYDMGTPGGLHRMEVSAWK